MGLLSDGGVHSHNTHLYALLEMCKQRGVKDVYVHCFMDGRDVPPTSGIEYVKELEAKIKEIGVGKIATVEGRYWAMDRDNLWDRVQKAYDAMVLGEGVNADNAEQAVEQSYAKEETDEFIKPTVIMENGKPVATIGEGDSVIFYNFRPDRARQLTRTFIMPDFDGFKRGNGYFHVNFVSMTQYDETFTGLEVVNPPEELTNTLGEYLAKNGQDPAAHRRDSEVRPRDLLLQRRRGEAQRGRGSGADPLLQGGDLRPEARNVRLRGDGKGHRAASTRRSTT